MRELITSSEGDLAAVARYYDANTRRFLWLGVSRSTDAIRRPVWAPGISRRREAIQFVDAIAAELLGEGLGQRVLDLGCGVGATCHYLAQRRDARCLGVSLSSVQVELARRRSRELGLSERCEFVLGDCVATPAAGEWDLIVAVESLVHVPDVGALLAQVARRLRPGGVFLVCDDFLGEGPREPDRRWLDDYRQGWHAHSLRPLSELVRLARGHGLRLRERRDLTDFLEPGRPRSLAIRLAVPLLRPLRLESAWWQNLLGGNALQQLLRQGAIRYQLAIWERA